MYMDVHFTATGATVIYALDINCAKHPIRGREKEGLVNAWAVGADGSLSLINSVPCGGITPCHCQLLRPPPGEHGQTLLLRTLGVKTGKRRTASLAFMWRGEDMIVIASKGGAPHPPRGAGGLRPPYPPTK